MTAKQIMDFMEENGREEDMFGNLEIIIKEEKFNIVVQLEHTPDDKTLKRKYINICEKLRAIQIMREQRLELYRQAGIQKKGG